MSIDNISNPIILYFTLSVASAIIALIACIYLLFRKGNAFSPDITSPMPLRRWAAAFYAVIFLAHIWWILFLVYSNDVHSLLYVLLCSLDCVTLLTTIAGTLLTMLQDRKRHVWPVIIVTLPYMALFLLHHFYPGNNFYTIAIAYIMLCYLIFAVYMAFAVKKYGRWLRDNYADLENKEVWQSYILIIVFSMFIFTYGFDTGNIVIGYIVQVIILVLLVFMLWRVETLPQLENVVIEEQPDQPKEQLEELLDERCVATQLYLQHDITLPQLAKILGTNRTYLSQYISYQGITFNAYINNLRINHFMKLYREAVSAGKTVIVKQLASESGFRSYSTFSLAFKQRMGQSVTTWMQDM